MLSVTVTMLRDMVESVMLLKEEACGGEGACVKGTGLPDIDFASPAPPCSTQLPTRSACRRRCFLRRRLCFRMSLDEVLCSVELLSLGTDCQSSEELETWVGGGTPLPQCWVGIGGLGQACSKAGSVPDVHAPGPAHVIRI